MDKLFPKQREAKKSGVAYKPISKSTKAKTQKIGWSTEKDESEICVLILPLSKSNKIVWIGDEVWIQKWSENQYK